MKKLLALSEKFQRKLAITVDKEDIGQRILDESIFKDDSLETEIRGYLSRPGKMRENAIGRILGERKILE